MTIMDIINIVLDFLALLGESLGSVWGFFRSLVSLIPELLGTIFNNMPSFLRYGCEALVGFIVIVMFAKFIALIIPMKK